MKRVLALAMLIFIFVTNLFFSAAYAQKSLGSGYRVTTDHHGQEVLVGENVAAWADTTDNTTTKVIFTWIYNDTTVKRNVTVEVYTIWYTNGEPGVPDGTEVYRFTDTYQPDEVGEWAVKAKFINSEGQTSQSDKDSFPVRATSFNTIPYTPLGTIAIILLMAVAFITILSRKNT